MSTKSYATHWVACDGAPKGCLNEAIPDHPHDTTPSGAKALARALGGSSPQPGVNLCPAHSREVTP